MNWTGCHQRVLQVHPSRRCNLKCLHCYSTSGPREVDDLDRHLLLGAIRDAACEGYNVVSVSGGEPLLYSGLPELLHQAKQLGLRTTVTTNGILLNRRRLSMLGGLIDLVAISIDGMPESHNRLRDSGLAFQAMRERLPGLREAGFRFGFIFTLTRHNVNELPWVAKFAHEEGARSLQIHPLEEAGRAESLLQGSSPTDVDAAMAWLHVNRLSARYGKRLTFHTDFVHRNAFEGLLLQMENLAPACREPGHLAGLVSPRVIEADGDVVPAQYGFPREYGLGSLRHKTLTELAADWMAGRSARFATVCRRTMEGLLQPAELPFINWYQELTRCARQAASPETFPIVATS